MGFLTDWLTDWLKELLIEGIMGNLMELPDQGKRPGVPCRRGGSHLHRNLSDTGIDRIKKLSETVILPIAGLILTFVATYELIQLIIEKNNLHDNVC
mgnify:CR=1 FL=1